MAELDEWAELAGAGNAAGAMWHMPADADAEMTYEQLCQAHIEAFIQVFQALMTGLLESNSSGSNDSWKRVDEVASLD